MDFTSNQINLLKKAISEYQLTVFTGIFTIHKKEVIGKLIDLYKETNNCVVLDFSNMNVNRKYESTANIKILETSIKPNENNFVFILEFTNCSDWNLIIDYLINTYKNIRIFCSSSCNFSSTISFFKNSVFNYVYKEVKYYPITMHDYFLECFEPNYPTFIKYGSAVYNSKKELEKIPYINQINFLTLFNIFYVLTKVRSHFYVEIFFRFLLENLDKKLTILYIKQNINKMTKLYIKNAKIFWKYINLLLDLYILIPVQTISINNKSKRVQSKFAAIDHMLFNMIEDLKKRNFLIGRNIFLNEFIKKELQVYAVEDKGNEIGLVGYLFNEKKIIVCYDPSYKDKIIKGIVGVNKTDEYDISFLPKTISEKQLVLFLENLNKNIT